MTALASVSIPAALDLFTLPLVCRVRDHCDERIAAGCQRQDWSVLHEVAEEMIAGQRDSGEIYEWICQFQIESRFGLIEQKEW